MVSKTAKYGLRAVAYIAHRQQAGEDRVRIDDVAEELGVPRNYLSKVMYTLGRAGILASTRGPGGGFRLVGGPDQIRLGDVIGALDSWTEGESPCLLWDGPCTPDAPCVAHHRWREIADDARLFLVGTSIQDLLEGADHPALTF